MSQLGLYPLPYTERDPPAELYRDIETTSEHSATTGFNRDVDDRDVFLGTRRCVVCGTSYNLQHCYIIRRCDKDVWYKLQSLGWLPPNVKQSPEHEPRNGLVMCVIHQHQYDEYCFFIRWIPHTKKYTFIHYDSLSLSPDLIAFHGKDIALDYKDCDSPLPLLLLVHEYMARGRNFFQPTNVVQLKHVWQDWILNSGALNAGADGSFTFTRSRPPIPKRSTGRERTLTSGDFSAPTSSHSPELQSSPTPVPPSQLTAIAPPTHGLVEELLASQRSMLSWKTLQQESLGWEGTADENIKRYVENVGVDSENSDQGTQDHGV